MGTDAAELILDEADLDLFAAASLDRSPLHMSEVYTRATPYGRRVTHGVLTALACMGRLPARPSGTLASVTLDFQRPVFPGIRYALQVDASADKAVLRLRDGALLLLKATLRFAEGGSAPPLGEGTGRAEAADLAADAIAAGREVTGTWGPASGPFTRLWQRLGLEGKGIGEGAAACLMACSYLVGMELPGRRALFSQLALSFSPAEGVWPAPFRLRVAEVDDRFALATMKIELGDGRAEGELRAHVRADVPPLTLEQLHAYLPPGEALRGQVALVVGASRGLGAALALGLASRGATVIAAYHRSEEAARRLQESAAGLPGAIELARADAGDARSYADLEAALARHGRLDLLVCSAFPAPFALPLGPASIERFNAFLARALPQVSVPLLTFLDRLRGRGVVISSSAVTDPPREWPHYVSAKVAVEALARFASDRVPFLVVRPPRLLTDMTNTVTGRDEALPVERVAAAIVRRLEAPAAQPLEVLEDFGGETP